MRDILYKKRQSLKNHRKMISINEHSEDKECKTHVRKSFIYIVKGVAKVDGAVSQPDIYIKKFFDTKSGREDFSFRVKGAFFMTRGHGIFKIHFCHTLKINITWKNKVFSPNKSVTLT